MKYKLRHPMYYLIRKPYNSLKNYISFQHSIYSIPREARPAFWAVHEEITIAKAQMAYDIGKLFCPGPFPMNIKDFDGLGSIIDDGTDVSTYNDLTKTTYKNRS
jgi:hypothetical protein